MNIELVLYSVGLVLGFLAGRKVGRDSRRKYWLGRKVKKDVILTNRLMFNSTNDKKKGERS